MGELTGKSLLALWMWFVTAAIILGLIFGRWDEKLAGLWYSGVALLIVYLNYVRPSRKRADAVEGEG